MFSGTFGKFSKVEYLFWGFANPNKYGPCPGTHKYGSLLKMATFEEDMCGSDDKGVGPIGPKGFSLCRTAYIPLPIT